MTSFMLADAPGIHRAEAFMRLLMQPTLDAGDRLRCDDVRARTGLTETYLTRR